MCIIETAPVCVFLLFGGYYSLFVSLFFSSVPAIFVVFFLGKRITVFVLGFSVKAIADITVTSGLDTQTRLMGHFPLY